MAQERSCELEAFTSMKARLKSFINPIDLIAKCYSECIIEREDFEDVEDAPSRPKKATILLAAVEKSIERDPAFLNKFLDVLRSEVANRTLVYELGTH